MRDEAGGVSRALARPARPGDAAALVALASAVGVGAGGLADLATSRWRSVADERRYLRALRRHPDAAVFVAETRRRDRRPPLDLARPASREPPRRRPRPDGRRRRTGAQGVGTALLEQAVEWARAAGVRKLELHVFPHNEPAIALYEKFGFEREGYRREHYRRGGGVRRRDPDGVRRPGRRRAAASRA